MSLPARVAALVTGFLAVAALAGFVIIHYFLTSTGPPFENFAAHVTPDAGASVNVTLQEAPQATVGTEPSWVSYFLLSPQTHRWVHTTNFDVPAGSRVNVTIYGYDGCTPLRNPLWGRVEGTIGGVEYVNGRRVSKLNSWDVCSVAHTFAIPTLGLVVPVASPTSLKANNNLCGVSPCTPASPHTVVKFSFMTPRSPGIFYWQCLIPCGLGFLDGNGGPMQTIGYMTGNMQVVG